MSDHKGMVRQKEESEDNERPVESNVDQFPKGYIRVVAILGLVVVDFRYVTY